MREKNSRLLAPVFAAGMAVGLWLCNIHAQSQMDRGASIDVMYPTYLRVSNADVNNHRNKTSGFFHRSFWVPTDYRYGWPKPFLERRVWGFLPWYATWSMGLFGSLAKEANIHWSILALVTDLVIGLTIVGCTYSAINRYSHHIRFGIFSLFGLTLASATFLAMLRLGWTQWEHLLWMLITLGILCTAYMVADGTLCAGRFFANKVQRLKAARRKAN